MSSFRNAAGAGGCRSDPAHDKSFFLDHKLPLQHIYNKKQYIYKNYKSFTYAENTT